MGVALRGWVEASRVRRKLRAMRGGQGDMWGTIHEWMEQHASGRSFVDIGSMWGEHWGAFDAADRGAREITVLDITAPTDECVAEQGRRGVECRYVVGDVHDTSALRDVGEHDVVLCSGVLYHCPHPVMTLERLRQVTREHLIFTTQTLQEVPGFPQVCIFYPELPAGPRAAFASTFTTPAVALSTPFDPAIRYDNWWWGISRSALQAMFRATGWDIVDQHDFANPRGYVSLILATPTPSFTAGEPLVAVE